MEFEIYQDKAGEWRWRLQISGNNKIIADSGEGYTERAECEEMVVRIKTHAASAVIKVVE